MEVLMTATPIIESFFDESTNTISYLVIDPATRLAAVIDPVLDFDLPSGEVDTGSALRIPTMAQDKDWRITMVLEIHPHADHLPHAPSKNARAARRARGGQSVEISGDPESRKTKTPKHATN